MFMVQMYIHGLYICIWGDFPHLMLDIHLAKYISLLGRVLETLVSYCFTSIYNTLLIHPFVRALMLECTNSA